MSTLIAHSLEELPAVAGKLLHAAAHRKVWLFEGEMGAGKTTLIKILCQQLGVVSGMSSPTFAIVNEYTAAEGKVFHFDLYRLKEPRELADIGFDDYLYSGHHCFIEWPYQVPYDYPPDAFRISIRVTEEKREFTFG